MKTMITTVAAATILFSGVAVANAAERYGNAPEFSGAPYDGQIYTGQIYTGRSVSIGRYTKTPTGDFNSTESLLDGTASGDGSGPYAGSPNGN